LIDFYIIDEEDSVEFNAILSDLRDFKFEFDENSNFPLLSQKYNQLDKLSMNHYSLSSPKSSSSFSTNGCVHELRTLEDQLEAALASLALTINDNIDSQQHCSSDSSACSSGLGEEIGNESFHLYNISNPISFTSKLTTTTDDCDSAFSDGSTDKVTLTNHDESVRINRKSR
jgi:hypothetical protein